MKRTLIFILSLVLALGCIYAFMYHNDDEGALVTDNLLRLHIVASSDLPRDQALKLKIKDKITQKMGPRISALKTKEEALDFLRDNAAVIEEIAKQEAMEQDVKYDAKAEVGIFPFPTRSYGHLVLPAGKYEALRIVLGEGQGANWWCVMFPPLCFVDTKNAVALGRDQERIEELLAMEELNTENCEGEGVEIPVRVRFKVLELIKKSGGKLANTFKSEQ